MPDLVAENLYKIFLWIVTIEVLVVVFGVIRIFKASSSGEVLLTRQYTGYAFMVVFAFFIGFQFFVDRKIISKLENFSPLAQYNVIKIGKKPIWIAILGILFMMFLLIFAALINNLGMQDFTGNEIVHKILDSLMVISFPLISIPLPTMRLSSLPFKREWKISLNAIQSFEDALKKSGNDMD